MKAPKMRSATPKKVSDSVKSSPVEHTYDDRKRMTFTESQLPELADWKPGEKYCLKIEVEQLSIEKITSGPDKGKIRAEFAIEKVGAIDEDEDGEYNEDDKE